MKPTAGRFEKRKKISIFNSHAIAAQLLKVLIEEVFRPVGAQVAPAVASAAAFRAAEARHPGGDQHNLPRVLRECDRGLGEERLA